MRKSFGESKSSAIVGGTAHALLFKAVECLRNSEPIRLVDLGCGNGEFIRSLPPRFQTVGVDYNQSAQYTVNVSCEPLPFPDSSFDVVTAWQVFEHLENPFFAGREVARILKRGGAFLMSVPNIQRLRTRWHFLFRGRILRWSKKNDHLFVPLESVLRKTFLRNFRIVTHVYRDGGFMAKLLPKLFGKNEYYVAIKL